MSDQQMRTNYAVLSGKVVTEPIFSHEIYGEKFFEIILEVKRLSDSADNLPISVSERLMSNQLFELGSMVTVVGQFRSYNRVQGDRSRLMLTVFVRDILPFDESINPNTIELVGYICKPPVFRTTPFNREITDILLAVNRQYNKSDYIPCIAWGRNARYVKSMPVGEQVAVFGRIQSRVYQKRIDEANTVSKIAYEVSVSKIVLASGMEEKNDDSDILNSGESILR